MLAVNGNASLRGAVEAGSLEVNADGNASVTLTGSAGSATVKMQ